MNLRQIESAVEELERVEAPLHYWVFALLSIFLLRFFIESLLEGAHSIYSGISIPELVFWFTTLYLSVTILLSVCAKTMIAKTAKSAFYAFSLILLVPITDFVITGGKGIRLEYILVDADQLLNYFIPFMAPDYLARVSPGQSLAMAGGLALCGAYSYMKTGKAWRAAAAMAGFNLIFFVHAVFPNVYRFAFNKDTAPHISYLFAAYETLLVLLSIFLLILYFYLHDAKKLESLARNLMPTRLLHYASMAIMGALVFYNANGFVDVLNAVRSVFFVMLAFIAALMVNDVFDKELSQRVSRYEHFVIAAFCLAFSLMLALQASLSAFWAVLAYMLLGFAYSSPPLRLKNLGFANNLVIGAVSLFAFWAGFFSQSEEFLSIPAKASAMVLVVFSLSSAIKDLKDTAADTKRRVYTLPVLLGKEKAGQVVRVLTSLSFLLAPLLLGINALLAPAILFTLLNYILFFKTRKPEQVVFALYFLFSLCVAYYLVAVPGIWG